VSAAGALAPLRAGLEDYLPLLIMFVIWWVSSRRGKSNPPPTEGPDQAPSSAPRPGSTAAATEEITPIAVLRQMLFGGLEFPNLPANQLPPESQRPAEFGNAYRQESDEHHEPPSPPPAKRVVAATPARAEIKPRPVAPTVTPPVGPHRERLSLVQARIPRRELQRAVAWSEVLAPPVGLRDPSRQPSPTLTQPA
jgi:hypothetical protein